MKQKQWTSGQIKAFRLKLKLTQRTLGERVGTTTQYIWMLEKGTKKPGPMLKLFLDCLERQGGKKERK